MSKAAHIFNAMTGCNGEEKEGRRDIYTDIILLMLQSIEQFIWKPVNQLFKMAYF